MGALRSQRLAVALLLASTVVPVTPAHQTGEVAERLPSIGAAADFRLTAQDGTALSLTDLRGKVVAISFIYTRCPDTCPLLTTKLVGVQKALGSAFGDDVFFLSITVDPEHDRPAVLERYAESLRVDLGGWAFLTGTAEQIRQVARDYGVFHETQTGGDVNHNLLTSLVDRQGLLRVQYMGERFDPNELLHDLQLLAASATAP